MPCSQGSPATNAAASRTGPYPLQTLQIDTKITRHSKFWDTVMGESKTDSTSTGSAGAISPNTPSYLMDANDLQTLDEKTEEEIPSPSTNTQYLAATALTILDEETKEESSSQSTNQHYWSDDEQGPTFGDISLQSPSNQIPSFEPLEYRPNFSPINETQQRTAVPGPSHPARHQFSSARNFVSSGDAPAMPTSQSTTRFQYLARRKPWLASRDLKLITHERWKLPRTATRSYRGRYPEHIEIPMVRMIEIEGRKYKDVARIFFGDEDNQTMAARNVGLRYMGFKQYRESLLETAQDASAYQAIRDGAAQKLQALRFAIQTCPDSASVNEKIEQLDTAS
ncbi:MAG: hypothetical protein M1837_001896 [Sclerophora amabilis]|nr:MAG: hypothetical protein M1837_001896 [Sclerophora amabilis]